MLEKAHFIFANEKCKHEVYGNDAGKTLKSFSKNEVLLLKASEMVLPWLLKCF